MVSAIDRAKRALVTLLNSLAAAYRLPLGMHRDSPDDVLRNACRKVSSEVHADRIWAPTGLQVGAPGGWRGALEATWRRSPGGSWLRKRASKEAVRAELNEYIGSGGQNQPYRRS